MKLRKADAAADAVLKKMSERQEKMERNLSALVATVQKLEARLAQQNEARGAQANEGAVEALAASATPSSQPGVKPQIAAAIAAAATVVANGVVKARSARAVQAAQDTGSAWSQQGRVGAVSSHNLR